MDLGNGGNSYWTKRRRMVSYVDTLMNLDPSSQCCRMPFNFSEEQTQPEPNESNCAGLLESADIGAGGRDTLDNPNADSAIITGDEYDNRCSSDDDVATRYIDSSLDSADEGELRHSLKKWALDYGATLEATSALLRLLQPFQAALPLDARTLLSTSSATQLNVKEIDGGSYHHFGVESQLQKLYKSGMLIGDEAKDNCDRTSSEFGWIAYFQNYKFSVVANIGNGRRKCCQNSIHNWNCWW
jgi:hypothetical protein